MEFIKTIPDDYYIYAGIGILLLGIILGFTKTITVYRDFADLTIVFMLVLVPVGLFSLLGDKIQSQTMNKVLIVVELMLVLWILVSTFIDNRNPFKTLLAFITKIPLGVIFAIYLVNLVAPGGKSKLSRSQSKGFAGIILLFLSPILFGLVKNKVWLHKKE